MNVAWVRPGAGAAGADAAATRRSTGAAGAARTTAIGASAAPGRLYAYPREHLPVWQTLRAQAGAAAWDAAVAPGLLGEDMLLQGLAESQLWIGDRLVVGSGAGATGCVLAVTGPRLPTAALNARLGFAQAEQMMRQSGLCGCELAVLVEGSIGAGDPLTLLAGVRAVSVCELFRSRTRR